MEKFLDALNARPKKLFVTDPFVRYYNTQTCPCNILCFSRAEKKNGIFHDGKNDVSLYMLERQIVGTC